MIKYCTNTFIASISAFILFLVPPNISAQSSANVTTGFSTGIVGQGDYLIPSVHLGYERPIASQVRAHGQIRSSHLSSMSDPVKIVRARLTYIDLTVGVDVTPIEFRRHRLTFGLGLANRARWEKRALAWQRRIRNGVVIDDRVIYDETRSVDTGAMVTAMYSVRLSRSFRVGAYMQGYTYDEGTSVFHFGMQTFIAL